MIKAIVFDFFDVIHGDPYKTWLQSHGFKREDGFAEASDMLDLGQINLDDFVQMLTKLSHESADSIISEFRSVPKIDQGVVKLIDKLHKNYLTALLSNAPSASLRATIKNNDLEKHFDEIVISSEVGFIKPSKEIFDLLIARLKIDPSEIIFIDDSKHHIEGAGKVGIKSIQFISVKKLINDLREAGISLDK